MKFYIASRYNKKGQVEEIQEILKQKGHEISFDWTRIETFRPYNQNKDKVKEISNKNIEGVKNSDVFILITDAGGTDMYVELGIALYNLLEKGKPKIYVLGDYLDKSSFYFHPLVKVINNINEIQEI